MDVHDHRVRQWLDEELQRSSGMRLADLTEDEQDELIQLARGGLVDSRSIREVVREWKLS